MGRKAKTLSDSQKAEITTLASIMTQDQIADYFGISKSTFQRLMKEDETIETLYKKGQAKALSMVGSKLLELVRSSNPAAIFFYLKTKGGWRERAPVETPLMQGYSVANVDLSKASDEQLARMENLLIEIKLGSNENGV